MGNFHSYEVMGCGSETQLQVDEKLNYLIWHLNPYSAGIEFSRQNLASVDVRF